MSERAARRRGCSTMATTSSRAGRVGRCQHRAPLLQAEELVDLGDQRRPARPAWTGTRRPGTISSSWSMLRPMAALTLVSMMIGCVKPWRRSSRAMVRPSSGSSIMTSRMSRSGLTSSICLHAVGAVRGAVDLVALLLQDEACRPPDDVGVVVDDQDLGHLALLHSIATCPDSSTGAVARLVSAGEAPCARSQAPGPVSSLRIVSQDTSVRPD